MPRVDNHTIPSSETCFDEVTRVNKTVVRTYAVPLIASVCIIKFLREREKFVIGQRDRRGVGSVPPPKRVILARIYTHSTNKNKKSSIFEIR